LIIGKNLELLSSLEKELNSLTSWVFQSVPNRIKFKYRFSAQSGNSISAQFIEENNLNNASGLPFIATKEVSNDGHINYDSDIKIPLNISHLFRLAKPGTVFLCSEGGSAGRKFAINEEVVAYGNKLFSISSKSFMSAQTLFHIFRTDNFQNQFALNMNGLIGGISSSALGEIEIPDISGDDEIILLQNLEKINGDYLVKRDKINRILELLREYKIALISNTVTGEFSFNRELGEII
jgi:type I restriction enzyme S subunit